MFLSENFYGCFVYNVLQNNERDKMESMRAAASHLSPFIFSPCLSSATFFFFFFFKERTGSMVTVLAVQYTAERASLNVETERLLYTLLTPPLHSAVFWCCRVMELDWEDLEKGMCSLRDLQHPAGFTSPSSASANELSAFTVLSSDRGNESETHLFSRCTSIHFTGYDHCPLVFWSVAEEPPFHGPRPL